MARAEFLRRLSGVFQTTRGHIYFIDKNNNSDKAAFNKNYPVIFVVPTETQANKTANYAEKLSPILNISIEELEKNLTNPTMNTNF